MKYLIWRHENALGNSAEQTVGLAKYLYKNPDDNIRIFVENPFQYFFALCIPGITDDKISILSQSACHTNQLESILKFSPYSDLVIPSVYWNDKMKQKKYTGSWSELVGEPEQALKFPVACYNNKHSLPENTILIQIRERGTYYKRVDGAESEPQRFVNPETFFKVALHYAENGYKVVRIGDPNQTAMPQHPNIIDFAKFHNKSMFDDLYLIATCKVFLSSDSGVWPMAGGMKKNLVLSNVAGTHYVKWLPKETTKVLFKNNGQDNSFEELVSAVDSFL